MFTLISINFFSIYNVHNIDNIAIDTTFNVRSSSYGPPDKLFFKYSKAITINNSSVSGIGTHKDFPVLISILDSDLHDDVQSNGNDIAFSNDTAWLDHEIELFNQAYNGTHAQLVAWVRIPSLSTSVDTVIRMYYGNSTMSSQQNPSGVWLNYEAVYHLNQDPSSQNILDSTSNSFDLTPGSGFTSDNLVNGTFGKAIDFESVSTQYLEIASGFSGPTSSFTIEMWFLPNLRNAQQEIFEANGGSANSPQIRYTSGNSLRAHIDANSGHQFGPDTSYTSWSNQWYHFVLHWDGSTGKINYFINNNLDSNSQTNPSWAGTHKSWTGFSIGTDYGTYNDAFDGIIEEIKISAGIHSNDWISTEFSNQNDPLSFFSIGSEEELDFTPPTYLNLIESSDPLELGDTEVISINVTDLSGIKQVYIEFPGVNYSMTNIDGNTWQNDSWTPNSVGNYTYTIWMEDNYNNWNSTTGTIEVIDTTPPTYSDLIESADPLQIGQNETISIKVFDSPGSGVNQVILEYESLNHTMENVGPNTWSWSNWRPSSENIYNYKIHMQDMENNWNMTSGAITVVNTTGIVIENLIESADPLELGNDIIITVDVYDTNTSLSSVLFEFDGVNHTMQNCSLVKNNSYNITLIYGYNWTNPSVGTFLYTIYANDSGNNWNSFQASFNVIDSTSPTFSALFESDNPLELGDTITISINASDLTGINRVMIEFEGSNQTLLNISKTWTYNLWTPSNTGSHSYTIWIEDNYRNWNYTSSAFMVQDTTPPTYSDLTESDSIVELGNELIISINCTDLAQIDVLIEFENANDTMDYIGFDIWQYTTWRPISIGNYTYKIYIIDRNDNLNYVSSSILFQDTIIPVYSNLYESDDPLELGDNQIIRIDTYDFAGINQSLLEFEETNHSMSNIYGGTWQFDLWTPNNWIVYQYKIHIEDKSGNWNFITANITVQDTTPPLSPILTNSPSGEVSGVLTFDWLDGTDPSGISNYILMIDNESNPYNTPGYIFITNITNIGSESSYLELQEVLPPGRYYFFLIQMDGVGQQSSYTMGTFTMISIENGNNEFMLFLIIGIISASVIVSVTTVVVVKRRIQKKSIPRRKKVALKIILTHIDDISTSSYISEKNEIQKPKKQEKGTKAKQQKESISNEELMVRINKIKIYDEKLLTEGAYLEAQKQFEFAENILLKLGKNEEALLFSDLTIGIKELSEERDERLEMLEKAKLGIDSLKIFDLYYSLIELSEKLKDYDSADMYLSELTQFYQTEQILLRDLEYQRFKFYKLANTLTEEKNFEKSVELYEKCEKISQFLVHFGRENEKNNVKKFRDKINECLSKAAQK